MLVPFAAGDISVLVMSIGALIVYGVIGILVYTDARSQDVSYPQLWGLAVFLAMLFATLLVSRQILGAIVAGAVVVGVYLLIARR